MTLHVRRHGVTLTITINDRPIDEFLEILRTHGWEPVVHHAPTRHVDTTFPFSDTDDCPCPDCRAHKENTHV
jgi:hypothetical protein